jgi:hypothetical protein
VTSAKSTSDSVRLIWERRYALCDHCGRCWETEPPWAILWDAEIMSNIEEHAGVCLGSISLIAEWFDGGFRSTEVNPWP